MHNEIFVYKNNIKYQLRTDIYLPVARSDYTKYGIRGLHYVFVYSYNHLPADAKKTKIILSVFHIISKKLSFPWPFRKFRMVVNCYGLLIVYLLYLHSRCLLFVCLL